MSPAEGQEEVDLRDGISEQSDPERADDHTSSDPEGVVQNPSPDLERNVIGSELVGFDHGADQPEVEGKRNNSTSPLHCIRAQRVEQFNCVILSSISFLMRD